MAAMAAFQASLAMGLTLDRCATLCADQVVDFLRSTADIVLILSFGYKRHAPVAVLAVEGVRADIQIRMAGLYGFRRMRSILT